MFVQLLLLIYTVVRSGLQGIGEAGDAIVALFCTGQTGYDSASLIDLQNDNSEGAE